MEGPIWHSALPAVEPAPAFVDGEILRAAERHAARPALVDTATGLTLTFGALAEDARRVAAALRGQGVGRGDVVSLVAASCARYAVALYGAQAAGATVASANPALTAPELARQFAMTRPKVVYADPGSAPAVAEALAAAGLATTPRMLDDPEPPTGAGAADGPDGTAGRAPDDLAFLFPSSGTTGLPKLAAHTHAGAVAFLRAIAVAPSMALTPADVVAIPVPFTHLYGTAMLTHGLRSGATVVAIALPAFDLEAFLRALSDHAVTVVPVTPPVVLALARHPAVDRYELSSLRLVISGAAPGSPEAQDAAETRLGCRVVDVVGSTEAWCYAPAADPPVRGSVGALGSGIEAAIVDPATGARLGADQPGELWVRGTQVMAGYFGDDAATAAALGPDGWLRTGDVCTLDAAGNLFIVDRLKELIKVGGHSVAPAEV
ncbi:MAG TPA: AMP-binding protein, partial [Candidatus Dormibacteraeota bacterium]